jgi:MFS family permease
MTAEASQLRAAVVYSGRMTSPARQPDPAANTKRPGRNATAEQHSENAAVSWDAVISTYVPALIFALGIGIALPAIPTLARSFHVSFGEATFVTTSFLLGNTLGSIPTGWMIDRFGRRRLMLAGPLLTAAMAFLVVTAQTFPQMVLYRFFDGFAAQMWLMGRLAGISYAAPANQRGRQVGWMFGMDNLGKLTGPLVGGFIAAGWGLRAPFAVYGVLALAALIPGYFFIKDTPQQQRAERAATAQVRRLSIREIVLPRLILFALALMASLARGPLGADLLHLYAAFAYHLSPEAIGFLATGASSVTLPLTFLSGWAMDRYGRKRLMVPGFISLAVAMVGLAVSAALHFPLYGYVALFMMAVIATGLTSGSMQTLGADVAPPEARGMFLGLWRFAGLTGTAASPLAFAFLADHTGYASSFVFVALSSALVGYLLLTAVPETGGKAYAAASPPTAAAAEAAAVPQD